MAMVLKISVNGIMLMVILGLMGREDHQIRFASGIRSLFFRVIGLCESEGECEC